MDIIWRTGLPRESDDDSLPHINAEVTSFEPDDRLVKGLPQFAEREPLVPARQSLAYTVRTVPGSRGISEKRPDTAQVSELNPEGLQS